MTSSPREFDRIRSRAVAWRILTQIRFDDLTSWILTFSQFADLVINVVQRASKYRSLPSSAHTDTLKLCLGSDDGYLIETEDIVKEVMTGPTDVLFIIFLDSTSNGANLKRNTTDLTGALQIRVITPSLAERLPDVRHIPLLQGGRYYSPATTLRELRHDVAQHLQIPGSVLEEVPASFCNCKLAELLVKRGEWAQLNCRKHNIMGCSYDLPAGIISSTTCAQCSQTLSSHDDMIEAGICQSYVLIRRDLPCNHVIHAKCLRSGTGDYDCPPSCYSIAPSQALSREAVIVFGDGRIEKVELSSMNHSALMIALTRRLGPDVTGSKSVICKGGLSDGEGYARLPIVAVCDPGKHVPSQIAGLTVGGITRSKLDLHTGEAPVSTLNLAVTLGDAKLADLALNGVLNIYAVERKCSGAIKKGTGQNAMFAAASHWQLTDGQSDRGTAAFLASLRVFSHVIGSEAFEDYHRNEVLRIVHALTRFPPTIRAVHILMDGKTLLPNESAAIVQSFAAVSEELIPAKLIANDARRSLEGARLILGLVLHSIRRNESPAAATVDDSDVPKVATPYLDGYQTCDLRDAKTMEAVTDPVLTK
jgi:hypothetical protein